MTGMRGAAREAHAGVMGDERRLNVHQIEMLRLQPRQRAPQGPPSHAPVLGIAAARRAEGDAQHAVLVAPARLVAPRRSPARPARVSTPAARQVGAEGADGGGDAVDARKIDVGNEQHPHALGHRSAR